MAQSDDSKMECELERRIGAAMKAVRSQVFENIEMRRNTKMLVYNGMIVPTWMHREESWVLKENEKHRIQRKEKWRQTSLRAGTLSTICQPTEA